MNNENKGWTFTNTNEIEWAMAADNTLFKSIGAADGLGFAISDVPAGHCGRKHHHTHAEFTFVLEGSIIANGVLMEAGTGYAAEKGTDHTQFYSEHGCKFISVFKIGQPSIE